MDFLRKLFDNNERDVRKYRKVVEKINAIEPQFKALTDEQLKAKTDEFRQRVKDAVGDESEYTDPKMLRAAYDKALDSILVEAFAACREAGWRALGMRHFDVQLIGGMVQHDGRISELRTGEGKTLTSTLATYLNAIAGKGVHLVTANDYLVKRDAIWMGPVYAALGMTVGILQGHSPETGEGGGTFIYDPSYEDPSVDGLDERFKYARQTYDRRDAYACDILYATSAELGFDYLRDNMAPTLEHVVQHRGHWFAIIDECDSNLIDEARTPLIISGTAQRSSELYYVFSSIMPQLEKGEAKKDKYDTTTDEKDYTVDEKAKNATFTERGMEKVEEILRKMGHDIQDISSMENLEYMQHAVAALKAHAVFELDIDYVVKPNQEGKPEIVIVDESTGRLMFGRRWSDGLHQAVEAKEGIKIENEQQTLATITIQNYFRLYAKLAGMTGTAKTEEDEFRKIYALDVVQVPTNKPMQRKDVADMIYKSLEAKLRGIASEVLTVHCRQQPLLVGTRSIEMSERVSSRLTFQALELLSAITILRARLLEKRKELGEEKYGQFTAVLNRRVDDLNLPMLAPLAKELGMGTKMTDEAQVAAFASLLGLDKADENAVKNLVALHGKSATEVSTELVTAQLKALREALEYGIPHNVLNAKYHEQEARIIAEAGRRGAVTIATNMAGRGVDILLGGSHYKEVEGQEEKERDFSYRRGGRRAGIAHVVTGRDQAASGVEGTHSLTEEENLDLAKEREEVRARGGLYILGTERHESRRIDNQLRGRSGRQGDPGTSKFHVSLEDYLWRAFGERNSLQLAALKAWEEDQAVDMPILSKMIERAQKKVEQHNFDSRKHVLEYDDVMNVQREVIYGERRKLLQGAELRDTLTSYLHETVDTMVELNCPDGIPSEEWDKEKLYHDLNEQFPLANFASYDELKDLTKAELAQKLHDLADEAYDAKEEEVGPELMREIERHLLRQTIDQTWIQHLQAMDYLREGIGLRGYAQVDPLVAYKKEAMEVFSQMQAGLVGDTVRNVFVAQLQQDMPDFEQEQDIFNLLQQYGGESVPMELGGEGGPVMENPIVPEVNALLAAAAEAAQSTAPRKIDPNDPCPCGSGKKYKQCHRGKPLPADVA
ncbi:preprotein translocase subunit SecA [Armatimonas rosea]|uniref:Protein translocase subunit SecA n=2 Tax=Armatimonas rosea TaxID=685828 RepID=A0A7W9W7N7_ARMRO|nr:preprotein translocase subunit SecA [Armatimonas rosea]MBB6051873.1 preprotein translocase subunit SecA [Armatimonas rosea]